MKFKLEMGSIAKSNTSSIAYLWSNWHVFYELIPGVVKARKLAEDLWEAKGLGAKGEWHLKKYSISVDEGVFHIFSTIVFLGFKIRGNSVFEYYRLDENRLAFNATAEGDLPNFFRPIKFIIDFLVRRAGSTIVSAGKEAIELLTQSPECLYQLNDEYYEEYMRFYNEEQAIINGIR